MISLCAETAYNIMVKVNMKLEEAKKLLEEEVESIRYSCNFCAANTWLAGFISALMRTEEIGVSELRELLDYQSELLWKNFD